MSYRVFQVGNPNFRLVVDGLEMIRLVVQNEQ